ncbi:glutamate--tRNA ligase [Saccharicrinis sp. FJH54]|uniref:glutamate--tRNA ligase n=1 Tax=Saccharicrinis sp. FJH54 TaxID=3344665 RepID=UPI0035D4BBB8
MSDVRVRFAPSPTGPLHMGGVRTALFNYLFARKHRGTFILRIEDTDQTRFVPGAEDYIIEALKWCGISPDEGSGFGDGPFAPYRQSERKEIYKTYSEKLVDSGWAYYAFDTPEELNDIRSKYEAEKNTFIYNHTTRQNLKNSLTLSADEVIAKMENGEPYVVRFRMPENETVTINDIVRGEVSFNSGDLDDKILFKSDGLPTYHLANVVDDYLMQISHVIRGEEWLPSLPLHALLYRALGWEDKRPDFAHLPLILKPVGQGKLSKRDGDKMGFPVFPLRWNDPKTGEIASGYREDGYLPEAFINMLALLGWNPGTDQEIFSLEELSNLFTLERVGKSGSKFDPEKTKWFNHQYLVNLDNHKLAGLYLPFLKEKGISVGEEKLAYICGLVKERATFVQDLWDQSSFFFAAPESYDEKTVRKRWKEQTPGLMKQLIQVLENVDVFDAEQSEEAVKNWITENELGMGAIMNAFRLAIVGEGKGPHMFDIIAVIGKEETIRRLNKAIEVLP